MIYKLYICYLVLTKTNSNNAKAYCANKLAGFPVNSNYYINL